MKKIYGFLGALALVSMVSCSSDEPAVTTPTDGNEGDLHMSMTIAQASVIGGRTATPNQGVEVGKDFENKITTGLLLLAEEKDNDYKIVTCSDIAENNVTASADGKTYASSFTMTRQTLIDDIKGAEGTGTKKEYYLFLIVNPTSDLSSEIKNAVKTAADNSQPRISVQRTFELIADGDTYWTANKFLMTNAEFSKTEIELAEIQPGKHTTKQDALKLGEVTVQRAMSRFDLALGKQYTKFVTETEEGITVVNSALTNLTVEFDAVALINEAKIANLFKEVGNTPSDKKLFATETRYVDENNRGNYVFSPDQTNGWLLPLYTGSTTAPMTGTAVAFNSNGLSYTLLSSLNQVGNEDNEYTHPNATSPADPTDIDYYRWRYCMENTNYTYENQLHGNSTGIVFRANFSGKYLDYTNVNGESVTEPEEKDLAALATAGTAIYSYNSVIYGPLEALTAYATGEEPEGDEAYTMVKLQYELAVAESTPGDGGAAAKYENLDKALVAHGFSIFRPTDGKYTCYYVYWNRHNDNGNNALMGATEFATVRNNVYKLAVSKINKLGHPANPEDDPEPEDPTPPDEKDELWGEVICKILPWEVRINNIEF